jgi:ATP-binding cassette subfamily B (MDR/TAP) protein 1
MHSASVSHAAEVEFSSMQSPVKRKRGLFFRGWVSHGGKEAMKQDPEAGNGVKNVDPDVSIFRLASLNKPEAPILFLGACAAIAGGVIFPVYGILLSTVIKTFYEPFHQLRKDANFWASMFVVLGCSAFVALTVQLFCFSVGGSKLVERVRRLTFEKVLQQEIAWFDESRNSRFVSRTRIVLM